MYGGMAGRGRTAFFPWMLRSFAESVKNFWPASRIPCACASSELLNALTICFCSSAESWREGGGMPRAAHHPREHAPSTQGKVENSGIRCARRDMVSVGCKMYQ